MKHVLALTILIPLLVFALSALLLASDPLPKLFTLYPVLLVSLFLFSPLNKPRVIRFRSIGNILGAILSMASLLLPYSFSGNDPSYPFGPWAVAQGVPHLILVGSTMTFLSKFGSIVTLAGILDWSPRPMYLCGFNGCPPYTLGPGYWVAWAGAFVSLLGRSWIALPRSDERRKLLGAIMFPVGLVLAILGAALVYAGSDNFGLASILGPSFIVTGFVLSGAGLNLFFRPESTTLSRIRRALQKPLW